MGNGFPIGACLVKKEISEVMKPGTHGSTYGGNPLSMAVGNAVLDIMTEPKFFPKVNESISYLHKSLDEIQNQFSQLIKEIRKIGFLIGTEFNDKISTKDLLNLCLKHGLIINKTANPNTIRLAPPIIITNEHIDQSVELLSLALQKI